MHSMNIVINLIQTHINMGTLSDVWREDTKQELAYKYNSKSAPKYFKRSEMYTDMLIKIHLLKIC